MTKIQIILFITLLIWTGCKRHRKIDVEGTITHTGTGQPIPNIKVTLFSDIKSSTESRKYETYTDNNGHYIFVNSYFSKPNFKGEINVEDPDFLDECCTKPQITKDDAKLIGHTKLTRDYEVTCISKLNTTLNINTPNYYTCSCYLKFVGERSVRGFVDFMDVGSPSILVGYSNGKNILKTVVKDAQGATLKTQYDTLTSNGCGTTLNFTLTIN